MLGLVAWFCMSVWVCPLVMRWVTTFFSCYVGLLFCTLSNLCILFLFAAVILLLRVVLMKLLLLPHGLLLHFVFHHDFSPGAQLSG